MSGDAELFVAVDSELARWRRAGLTPRIWLRDDDATRPTAALDRLLALTNLYRAPVLLAIIPEPAERSLAGRLAGEALVTPAVHGCAHRNHAPPDAKKTELTENASGRDVGCVVGELASGRARLRDHYGTRLSPMLVPPWNRISPAVAAEIAAVGFSALSLFGWVETAGGLPHLNTHVDLMDWRSGRIGHRPAGVTATLAARLAEARLRGGAPVGLLTHHLVHDDTAWSVLGTLLEGLTARGIRLASAAECLAAAASAGGSGNHA